MTATPLPEPGVDASVRRASPPTSRTENLVVTAAVLGTVLSTVGMIIGVSMALHRRVVGCENGHYFAEGTTDFRCFSHPHAGEGVSIAVLAALLGIVVALCCVIFRRLVARLD